MTSSLGGRALARLGLTTAVVISLFLLTVGANATQGAERTIYVSAVGGNGMPVVDPPLTVSELTVAEDGAAREITKITKAEEPVYFALMYETSYCDSSDRRGSCESGNNETNATQFVQQMREALNGFVSVVLTAAPTSKIMLMNFAGAAVVNVEFSSNIKDFEPILGKLVIQKGEPVLNEAVLEASHRFAKLPPGVRKVMVMVNREPTTDGSTGAQYNVMADDARKSGATIWPLSVRYGTRQNGGRDQLLKGLAANSGGLRITLGQVMQLGDYLRSVAANAIVQYAVTFKRPADAPVAKVTSVKTSRPGVQPLTLQWSPTAR